MRTLAKELVDLRPDAIFGVTTPAIGALARETRTIPIVFAGVSDPSGFVANLAHPGGNVTGFMSGNANPGLGGKWVELLKQIAPRTVRVALLFNPATAVLLQSCMPSIQAAASSLAVQVSAAPVHSKDEIEGVIAAQTCRVLCSRGAPALFQGRRGGARGVRCAAHEADDTRPRRPPPASRGTGRSSV
jgi:putative tryptophan/tyrosine transport system substrate-binding protein